MRYLGEDEVTEVMGIGYPGEVRQAPDGNLYQWVETVDGLGNPIGFWRKLRRGLKRIGRRFVRPVLRRALPAAQRLAPFIPGVGPAAATALKVATPLLRRAGMAGYNGPGALYQAPNGALYQGFAQDEELQGLAQDEELVGLAQEEVSDIGEDEPTQIMGVGQPGEVRQAPDGNLYQWVETVDGLGNPIGFWRKLRRGLKRIGRRFVRPVLRRVLPAAQRLAPFVPGVGPAAATALRVATPLLRRAGMAGYNSLGALYQAPDGTMYQVQGLAQDEELDGLAEDEELEGFSQDEELEGMAEEDEELQGFSEDEELEGLAQDEELEGLSEDEDLSGLDQGYVREQGTSGLEAYVPEQQPTTRWFVPPNQPPELWKPLW